MCGLMWWFCGVVWWFFNEDAAADIDDDVGEVGEEV